MNKRDETETPLELVDEVNHIRRIWIVQSALFFALLCVMLKGVPGVEKIFKDFDAELPKSTLFMLNVANLFTRYWYLAAGGWLLLMGALHLLCRSGDPSTAIIISRTMIVLEIVWIAFVAIASFMPLWALMRKLN